jgi:streptogramin lyase
MSMQLHGRTMWWLVASAAALLASTPAAADTGAITEHAIPTPASQPVSVVAGPDGALWFTEFAGDKIGRITTEGSIGEYPIPTPGAQPDDMTLGPDANLWFAETAGNKIGRITRAGAISEFDGLAPGSQPTAVAAGPDGDIWFTERALARPTGKIGRMTAAGVLVAEYAAGITGHPLVIAAGPDGKLWFTESPGNKIGRIDPATGAVDEYAVPTPLSAPWEIAAGPDGNLWFTERLGNKIGRIAPDGVITEFPVPTPASQPNTIRPGPDPNPADDCAYQRDALGETGFAARYATFGGCVSRLATTKTLWFSEQAANRLARITTDGDIFEYPLPTPSSQPVGLAEGPDGAVWFAEFAANKIGRLDVTSVGKPAAPGRRSTDPPPNQFTDSWPPGDRAFPH